MSSAAVSAIVLRRRSWVVLSWVTAMGLAVVTVFAVYKVTSVQGFEVGWQGIPVYLLLASVIGRFASSKVELGSSLKIVNPLRTHLVPASVIKDVVVADDGTLKVQVQGEEGEISVFAFGGSLIDNFRGTSEGACRQIKAWRRSKDGVYSESPYKVRWTRCLGPDVSLLLCILSVAFGAILMAFNGG